MIFKLRISQIDCTVSSKSLVLESQMLSSGPREKTFFKAHDRLILLHSLKAATDPWVNQKYATYPMTNQRQVANTFQLTAIQHSWLKTNQTSFTPGRELHLQTWLPSLHASKRSCSPPSESNNLLHRALAAPNCGELEWEEENPWWLNTLASEAQDMTQLTPVGEEFPFMKLWVQVA